MKAHPYTDRRESLINKIVKLIAASFEPNEEHNEAHQVYVTMLFVVTRLRKIHLPQEKTVISFLDGNYTHMVDRGYSLDIMFLKTLEKLGRMREDLTKVHQPILRLAKRTTFPIGAINLQMVLGEGQKNIESEILYIIIDARCPTTSSQEGQR